MENTLLNGSEILLIGGTGSLGNTLVRLLANKYKPKGIRIFSRGEFLQWKLQNELKQEGLLENISFLIGDIRDSDRVWRAAQKVDIIINCAALKQIDTCEYNPIEAIQTNIKGTENVVNAALDSKVKKVMFVSTDKSVCPTTLYGATKLVAEKLMIDANVYSGGRYPYFSCCRYGNVLGSRGSVIPLFREQAKQGHITITDVNMSRFWIKLQDVAQFLLDRTEEMEGKEIFIPKMKSCFVTQIAKVIAPNIPWHITGIRKNEKIDEILISYDESRHAQTFDHYFVIHPDYKQSLPFIYSSNPYDKKQSEIFTKKEIKELIAHV